MLIVMRGYAKMFRNIWRVAISDLFLIMRKAIGCRIRFKPISIVSPLASLKTSQKGAIYLDTKAAIRAGTEVSAKQGSVRIGENCFVNRDCMIVSHESIILKDNVTIGPGTYIYDHDHDRRGGFITDKIVIEENVWIGAGCIILKGVTIGKAAVIAAGTLVTKDVQANTIVYQKRENCIKEKKQCKKYL